MNHPPRYRVFAVALAFAGVFASTEAMAKKKDKTIHLETIYVEGRPLKPLAAVEINRLALTIAVPQAQQPFLERVEQAAQKNPF